MKKLGRKYLLIAISLIAVLGMLSSLLINLRPINSNENFIATVEQVKQVNGFAKVTVSLTSSGQDIYKDVKKYQIFQKNKSVSTLADINNPSVMFPAKKAGAKITVKLYTADKKEIDTVDLVLRKK